MAWPLVLLALLAFVRRRTAILAIVGVAILASVVLMATTYVIARRRNYVVAVDRLASLPARQLAAPVANLETSRYELTKALDFLFAGF